MTPSPSAVNASLGTMKKTIINSHLFACALIVLMSVCLYRTALQGDFIWDDRDLIVAQAGYLNDWKNLYRVFVNPMFGEIHYYRPVLTVSFIVDYQFWGTNPFGFHYTNLILHIVNGILVYLFAFSLFKKRSIALFTSLLFATHPVQSEAVAWISGRNDLLLTLFALIGIIAHLRFTRCHGWSKQLAYAGCLLAYGGAMLTKESAIILPLLFVLIDYFYPGGKKSITRYYAGIVLVSIIYYFAKAAVVGDMGIELRGRELLPVISGVIVTYAYYFRMLIFPFFQSAVPDIFGSAFDDQFFIISSFCLIFCLLLLAFVCRKMFKDISYVVLWIIISLIPVCGIVPLSLPALEHRLYLATVCFSMMLPLAADRLSCIQTKTNKINKAKAIVFVIVPAVLICYSAKTVARNDVWENELSFWSTAVHDSPGSSIATGSLGLVYARAGLHEMAIGEFKKALALADRASIYAPGRNKVHTGMLLNNLGQSYYRLLQIHVQSKAYLKPTDAADEKCSKSVMNVTDRLYELSLACYQRALRISPASADLHNNLGDLFYIMKNYPDAEEEYLTALKHNPDNAQYYNNLGLAYYSMKNYDSAEESFSRAISLRKDFLEGRNNLALVYLHWGMYQKALEQLEMVLSYGPAENVEVYLNLALVYLRGFNDRERAAYYLREAMRLSLHSSKNQMMNDSSCGPIGIGLVDRHT